MASDSDCSGANARLTTVIVIRNSAAAMAEPTWSWVTMPSQISLISSFGCEVITSDPDFPLIEIGTFTEVCSGWISETNHAGAGAASSSSSATSAGSGGYGPAIAP